MYIQKIATILMDDEINELLTGDDFSVQEYVFCDSEQAINLLEILNKKLENDKQNGIDNIYISLTIREIKEALILLEKDEIQNVVFVYQN